MPQGVLMDMQYHGHQCPHCKGGLRISGGQKKEVTVVLLDKVQDGLLTYKVCDACKIVVGPHYFYKRKKSGEGRGSLEGRVTLDFTMLHDPCCVVLMLDTSETIFVQRRLVEILYLNIFQHGMSVSAAAESDRCRTQNLKCSSSNNYGQPGMLLWQSAGIAVPANLPSQLSSSKGYWVQDALDVLMVYRAIEAAFSTWQQQQAGSRCGKPRALFTLIALRGAIKRPAADQGGRQRLRRRLNEEGDGDEADHYHADDEDEEAAQRDAEEAAAQQQQQQQVADGDAAAGAGAPQQQQQQQQQPPPQQPQQQEERWEWRPDNLPKGTLQHLLRRWVALPFVRLHGNFHRRNHRRCSLYTSPHQPPQEEEQQPKPHTPVMLLDATLNLQVHVCGIPGCRRLLEKGTDLWCGEHTPAHASSRMAQHKACCQVATRSRSSSSSSSSGGGAAWQACEQPPQPGSCFCSQHQGMQRRCGAAAAAEQQGLRASWGATRHDKAFARAGNSSGPRGGDAAGPPTPTPGQRQGAGEDDRSSTSPSSSSSSSSSGGSGGRSFPQQAGAEECLYVGVKARRGVVALSCAHCGDCCGASLMWSGQAETSAAGLQDILLTLEPLLRRCLPESSGAPAAAAAAAGGSEKAPLPQMVIIYNDAAAMLQYLKGPAPAGLKAVFKPVKWSVDMLRFLPTLLSMSAAGQPAAQQQQGPATDAEEQENGEQQAPAPAAAAALAAATATAAAAAAVPHALAKKVSPFRPAMRNKLIRRIRKEHAQPWLKSLRRKLCRLLPSQSELDAAEAAAGAGTHDNALLQLLSRANFARLSPGVVSLGEVLKHVLPRTQVKPAQRYRIFFRFKRRQQQPHSRKDSSRSGGSSSSSSSSSDDSSGMSAAADGDAADGPAALQLKLYEVLVDSEALERLWSRLQPGSTIGLKTQAHALAELQARLQLHNRLNALELAALQDWATAHYQESGGKVWTGTPPLPSRSQLWEERGLLRQVQAQLVTAPLLQQQAQPYSGLALPAGGV